MKPKTIAGSLRSSNLLIEVWPIDRPKDYPKNARTWSGQAVVKVASWYGQNIRRRKLVEFSDPKETSV
jgi:hypothetical protein